MAHDYPMNAFRKMQCGGGDTFLSGPDFDDGYYNLDDFKGCYLAPMTLTQLQVIMNRVKTWRVTVTYADEDDISQSYTFDTPDSPNYRGASGYREDGGAINWLKDTGAFFPSFNAVSDEKDFNLIDDFRGQSLEFQEIITTDPVANRDIQLSFSVGNSAIIGERYVDYYLKDADGATALTYDGQSEVYATLYFFAWDANPSGLFYLSSLPYDIDFSVAPDRITNAITITTCAGVVTSDVLSEGAGGGFSFEIEALEYWTYGGKFDSSTGQPT